MGYNRAELEMMEAWPENPTVKPSTLSNPIIPCLNRPRWIVFVGGPRMSDGRRYRVPFYDDLWLAVSQNSLRPRKFIKVNTLSRAESNRLLL